MQKKSLLALAVGAALAGSALAADVTLYGIVDTGLVYLHQGTEGLDGSKTNDSSLGVQSGYGTTSRWGIRGTEELGNGMTVSFKLENGLNVDTGTADNGERLFGREASLTLAGNFGQISFGRMGGVGSSAGTYDLVFATAEVFDGGDYNIWGVAHSARYDNMVTYQTPEFAGLQATFQYSFNTDSQNEATSDYREGSSYVDRYASAAVTGNYGSLQLVAAGEWMNWASYQGADTQKDGQIYYLGGNYDCGFAKTFFLGQYFTGMKSVADHSFLGGDSIFDDYYGNRFSYESDGAEGFGLHVGTIFNALAGDWKVGVYYADATLKNNTAYGQTVNSVDDIDVSYWGVSGRYTYYLSKRTSVYLGAGYAEAKVDANDIDAQNELHDYKLKTTQVYTGLTHTF